MNKQQFDKMRHGSGFVAALDQSGGSTPKALQRYGIEPGSWSGDDEMFELVHQMRTRIVTSPAFTGERILGAILFEMTMDRQVEGMGTAEYLWKVKHVVPFLKVDKGLAEEEHGVKVMAPIPDLDPLLERARGHGVFGTKMRSVVKLADGAGVAAVVDQQFDVARRILDAGLVPIIEPEVDIHSPEKAAAEVLLKTALRERLDALTDDDAVMLKLTLPSEDGFYGDLVSHPRVVRVVALSGGYSQAEADTLLARNPGVVASFSRALTEGLSVSQSPAEFDATLDRSIAAIYAASMA